MASASEEGIGRSLPSHRRIIAQSLQRQTLPSFPLARAYLYREESSSPISPPISHSSATAPPAVRSATTSPLPVSITGRSYDVRFNAHRASTRPSATYSATGPRSTLTPVRIMGIMRMHRPLSMGERLARGAVGGGRGPPGGALDADEYILLGLPAATHDSWSLKPPLAGAGAVAGGAPSLLSSAAAPR